MLEKLAAKLTRYMLSRGVISTEQEEIYGYDWALLLSRGYNGMVLEGLNRKFCAQKGSTNTSRLSVEPQNYLRAKFLIASEE